ncbi:hypothetical protein HY989_03115 [Candidatus Micrarchaeota archaeon]|nr:hypothetical protein [Candidatus Micrarchaeota archaeon]
MKLKAQGWPAGVLPIVFWMLVEGLFVYIAVTDQQGQRGLGAIMSVVWIGIGIVAAWIFGRGH